MVNIRQRYRIYVTVLILLVLSLVLTLSTVAWSHHGLSNLRAFLEEDAVAERLSHHFGVINDFPGSAGKDALFLRTLSSMEEFYDIDTPSLNWRPVHQDIQQFLERNTAYEAVYLYIDTLHCMVRVRKVAQESGESTCSNTKNGQVEEVLSSVQKLKSGQVYVSPIMAYQPESDTAAVPALLYGTKVSLPASADGAVVTVVNIDYFLEGIRRMQRPGEKVFIIDPSGNYIAHPDKSKEIWNGGTANFYQDHGELTEKIALEVGVQRKIEGDRLFTFMHVAPSATNFVLYDGNHEKEEEYWMIVAVSDMDFAPWYLSWSFMITALFITFVHLIILYVTRVTMLPRVARAPIN